MSRHPLSTNGLSQTLEFAVQTTGHESRCEIDTARVREVVDGYNDYCSEEGVDDVFTQATALTLGITQHKPLKTVGAESKLNRVGAIICSLRLLMEEADFRIHCARSFYEALEHYLEFEQQITADGIRRYYHAIWEHSREVAEK